MREAHITAKDLCVGIEMSEVQLIILDPTGSKILLHVNGDQHALVRIPVRCRQPSSVDLKSALKDLWGTEGGVQVSRFIWQELRKAGDENIWQAVTLATSNTLLPTERDSKDLQWARIDETHIKHRIPEAQTVIDDTLEVFAVDADVKTRGAFVEPEGFFEMSGWLETVLRSKGHGSVERFVQASNGTLSCVIKAETACGSFFMKASSSMDEIAITKALSELCPEYMVTPLVTDLQQRRMVSPDFGESNLLSARDLDEGPRKSIYADFARLQIAASKQIEALQKQEGVRVLSLPWMASNIEFLIHHPETKAAQSISNNNPQGALVLTALQEKIHYLEEACQIIDQSALPLSPVHNDFVCHNVLAPTKESNKHRFIDWGAGCLTHPFFEVSLHMVPKRILEHYLREWAVIKPIEELHACIDQKEFMAALCFAVVYISVSIRKY